MRYNEVDESLKNEIVEEYLSGISIMKLHEKYGPCKKSISNLLKERGIKIRSSNDEIYQIKSPYRFNEHWLDELDCAEKFYFLGFFAADGCNKEERNNITIKLQEGDKGILEKFKKLLDSDRPIYSGQDKGDSRKTVSNYVTLNLTSKYFCQRLHELGLPKAKTYIIQFPKYVPDKYMRDYIRGVFDGDGNITVSYANPNSPKGCCNIAGIQQFLKPISDYLTKKLNVHVNLHGRDDTVAYSMAVNRQEDIKVFLDWMYKDATIYLQRKYDKYQEFLSVRDFSKETIGQKRRRIKTQENEIIEAYSSTDKFISEIAHEFNCSSNTIFKVLERNNVVLDRELKRIGKLDN